MPFATCQEAEAFLLGFVNYEVAGRWPRYDTTHFDIARFSRLLDGLGAPHRRPGLIHVAGTKGKGSTCALLASILSAAGLRTGLYTSPHLESFCERIAIDGRPIAEDAFARLAGRIHDAWPQAAAAGADGGGFRTTFEILTAMALVAFADARCDAAVIETGLGGRLDATNVVTPALTIITALGLDHQHILGPTLADIAREKGGVIKAGVPCIVACQTAPACAEGLPVLEALARQAGAPLLPVQPADRPLLRSASPAGSQVEWRPDPAAAPIALDLPFAGNCQIDNLASALAAVAALRRQRWAIPDAAVAEGVRAARLAGRFEVICDAPPLILDGAHCALSIAGAIETATTLWPDHRFRLLFSSLSDKNVDQIAALLAQAPRLEQTILFPPPSPRACPAAIIGEAFARAGVAAVAAPDARSALALALQDLDDQTVVLATGSFYSVAPLRRAFAALRPSAPAPAP